MKKPKISIITPSFNQGAFIEETIKSVLYQDFTDLEYIIIDGGSTDNTLEVIKKYEHDKRVRWVSEKDNGQTHAINKGFAMAHGEILAWLNSDDVYEDEKVLSAIISEFDKQPDLVLVYGKCYMTDVDNKVIDEFKSSEFELNKHLNYDPGIIPQASAFFTSDVLRRVGKLDESLRFSMDYDLWTRMALIGKFKHVPVFLSKFRQHGASKTVKFKLLSRLETLKVARKHGAMMFSPMLFIMLLYSVKEPFRPLKNFIGKIFHGK